MAINYDAGQLPKGASNSNQLAQTPGTQMTAMQNVNTGRNINPNMPVTPQLQKQARSSFQQGLMKPPKPVKPAVPQSQAQQRQQFVPSPVISQTEMEPGRGYNIFSGMDANQISGMNQNMGLSNMTQLPSVAPGQTVGGMTNMFAPERQQQMQLMSGTSSDLPETVELGGFILTYNPETGKYEDPKPIPEEYSQKTSEETDAPSTIKGEEDLVASEEETLKSIQDDIDEMEIGLPAEELEEAKNSFQESYNESKQTLDEQYASQLQSMLMGIDRQMAMMGTFGSGSHMFNLNNATAQALQNMASEYAAIDRDLADKILTLEMQNLQQMELDYLSQIDKKFALADRLANLSDPEMDYNEKKKFVNDELMFFTNEVASIGADSNIGIHTAPITKAIENKYRTLMLQAETPEETSQIVAELNDVLAAYMTVISIYNSKQNKGQYENIFGYDDETDKNKAEAVVNQAFGEFLADIGLLDSPADIEGTAYYVYI